MQALKEGLSFIRDSFELCIWLLPMLAAALFAANRQKLLQGCPFFQKSIRISVLAIMCLLVANWIKDFSLSDLFADVPGGYFLHLAVKLLLVLAVVYLAVLMLKWFIRARESEKGKGFIKRSGFGLVILLPMLASMLVEERPSIGFYFACWYAVDYSMGPGPRFFIGSLCRLLFGNYITIAEALTFVHCTEVLIAVCMAYMGNRVYLQAEEKAKPAVAFLILCFLCSPFSFIAMFEILLSGRLEIYTLLLCLAVVLLFRRLQNTWLKYGLIAITGCVCNAIYHGFMFLYLPILLMLMIQDIFDEPQHPLRRLGAAVAACVPIGISFLFFQFFSYTNFSNSGEMLQALQQKTELVLMEKPLHYEMFLPFSTAFNDITVPFWRSGQPVLSMALFLVLILPVILLVVALYHSCFAQLQSENINKWKTPYPYFLLTLFAVLPQYALNVDWGRWTIALGVDLLFGILFLLYSGNREMAQAMRRLADFLKKHPALAVLTLLYLSQLTKLGQSDMSINLPVMTAIKRWL